MGPVLVVGAGPTGLVAAIGLARRRIPVRIIDQKLGPARESRAMGVQARTLEYYRQFDFADDVVEHGIKAGTIHFRQAGKEVARFSLAEMGGDLSPYPFLLCYPQDEHERLLIDQLERLGVVVEWGTRLDTLTQTGDGVDARVEAAGQAQTSRYAYVVGCDGARSRVREILGLGFPGGTYDQLFYVADVKVDGAEDGDVYANLGSDGIALMMPVRTSGMQRLIGLVPPALNTGAPLTWDDLRSDVEPLLGVTVSSVNWFSTYHVHHRVTDHFRKGRVFVAGDAGHIHSPTGGQGMNTGIGDAVNLAWKLAEVLRGRADPTLLDTYEQERIAFARKLVSTTDKAFQQVVAKGAGAEFVRGWLAPHLLSLMAGFSTTREMIFKTISQVRITYRESVMSDGQAGDVHGGDRLPWVRGTQDNFDALRSLGWQLHVYGVASDDLISTAQALGLPLHGYAWSTQAAAAGLQQNAAYLVRPDGYVALALRNQDASALHAFVERWDLQFG